MPSCGSDTVAPEINGTKLPDLTSATISIANIIKAFNPIKDIKLPQKPLTDAQIDNLARELAEFDESGETIGAFLSVLENDTNTDNIEILKNAIQGIPTSADLINFINSKTQNKVYNQSAMMQNINPNQKVDVVDLSSQSQNVIDKKSLLSYINSLVGQNGITTKDKKAILNFIQKSYRIDKNGKGFNINVPRHIVYSSLKDNRAERSIVVNNIVDLIKQSVMIEVEKNTKKSEKPYVDEYYRFYVPVRINSDIYTIRLVAENQNKNNLFNIVKPSVYDVIIDKKRTSPKVTNAPVLRSPNNSINHSQQNASTEQITIKDMLSNVEDADGNIYFQSAVTAGAETSAEISDAQKEWQEKGTDSKYFKKWFGDSKVVDENGKPLVVYHGTLEKFNKFDKNSIGNRFSYDERGFFFTSSKNIANDYSTSEFDSSRKGYVMPVYISAKTPLVIDEKFLKKEGMGGVFKQEDSISFWDNYQDFVLDTFDEGNYDGIIINDGDTKMVVAFEPTQIKSVDNQGTFDEGNANIYYQEGGNPKDSIEQRTDKSKYLTDNEVEQLKKDKENFVVYVQKMIDDKLSPLTQIRVLEKLPSAYNKISQLKGKKVVITQNVYKKIIDLPNKFNKNHNIDKKRALKLPEYLSDPLYILQSTSEGNEHRFVVVTASKGNKPKEKLSIILQPNNNVAVVSAYDEIINISEEKKNNRVLYDKKKELSKTLSTSKAVTIDNSDTIITNSASNFNPKQSQKRTGYVFQEPAQPNLFVENAAQNHNKGFVGIDLKGNRGLTDINRNLILIGTTGDVTTVLHESAHYFLNMLEELERVPDHSPKVDDVLFAIRKTLKNDGTPFTRSQHEKFAKGFEHYIYTGNARSNIFKEIYEDIKNLLKNIYEFVQKGQYFTTGEGALTEEEMKNFNNVFDEIFKLENKTVKERVFAKVLALDEKEEYGFFEELTLFLSLFFAIQTPLPQFLI